MKGLKMKRFRIKYLDNSFTSKEKIVPASNKDMAEIIFCNETTFFKITSIEEV